MALLSHSLFVDASFYLLHFSEENISSATSGQAVAVSICDGRIFFDGSLVQEQKFHCTDCNKNCDVSSDSSHDNHTLDMIHGDTYLSLGWGHLEVRLQTAFVQVKKIHYS